MLVANWCATERRVQDLAVELKELAEVRAKAWQAQIAAAEARMSELKEFGESRTSSADT